MSEPTLSTIRERFADPRRNTEFEPHVYPLINGEPAPAQQSSGRNNRIKLEFAAAYYELNGAHARLLALRNAPDFAGRREEERRLLQETERLLVLRDELEDECAPFGVIAEPIVEGGFTVDLRISFGNEDVAGRLRSDCYTISAFVPLSYPAAIKFDELDVRIEGPLIPAPLETAARDPNTPS